MSDTVKSVEEEEVEVKKKKPAGEKAEFYITSMFAYAREYEKGQYETAKAVDDEAALNSVVSVSPLSNNLKAGMTIKAERGSSRDNIATQSTIEKQTKETNNREEGVQH